jgi:hypothetical protein
MHAMPLPARSMDFISSKKIIDLAKNVNNW